MTVMEILLMSKMIYKVTSVGYLEKPEAGAQHKTTEYYITAPDNWSRSRVFRWVVEDKLGNHFEIVSIKIEPIGVVTIDIPGS